MERVDVRQLAFPGILLVAIAASVITTMYNVPLHLVMTVLAMGTLAPLATRILARRVSLWRASISPGIEGVEVVKGVHVTRTPWGYLAFTMLLVEDIPYAYSDFDSEDLSRYSRSFTSIISSVPGPFVVAVVKGNLDVSKYIKRLESRILHYKVMAQADPTNPSIEQKVARLERVLRRISRGEKPIRISMVVIVYRRGREKSSVVEDVASRSQSIRVSFESLLGLKCKKIGLGELMKILAEGKGGYVEALEGDLSFMTPITSFKRPMLEFRDEGIYLGEDMDTGTPVFYDFKYYSLRHMVVVGPTGRGKTTFLRTIARRISDIYPEAKIWILDFKGEFSELRSSGFKVVDAVKTPINVLSARHTNPKLKARQVVEAFKIVSNLTSLEEYLLYLSLIKVMLSGSKPRMSMVIDALRERAEEAEFTERAQVYGLISKIEPYAVKVFEEESSLDAMFKGSTVVDLSRLPEEYRDFYLVCFLQELHNYMLTFPPDESLRGVVVIDEAWRIMRSKHGRDLVLKLVKEGRAFGISVVLASQDLSDFPREILDNAGTIVVFGSNSKEYIEDVATYMSLNKVDKDRMMWMKVGEALVRIHGDPRPIWVKVVPEVPGGDSDSM